jgi:hypothetical protein
MGERCQCCRNLDSNTIGYSSQWTTGRVFQDNSVQISDVIKKSGGGCLICSFLLDVLDLFLPDWRSKQERLQLHVLAPNNRPFEVSVNEVPSEPNDLLRELINVQISNADSKFTWIALQQLYLTDILE